MPALGPIGDEEAGLPLVLSKDGHLYFRRHFEYERQIARAIALRLARPSADPDPAALDFFRQALAPQVDEHQALAVGTAMRKDLLLLTGGPGTGKTRTIVIMLAALLHAKPKLRVALAAPTGKAAFRMRESVLQTMDVLDLPDTIRSALVDCAEATTLHRLLGWQPGSVDFKRNAKNTLLQDLVILDEASMVDLPMMAKFCTALRDEAKPSWRGTRPVGPCRVDRFSTAWFAPMSPIVFPSPTWQVWQTILPWERAAPMTVSPVLLFPLPFPIGGKAVRPLPSWETYVMRSGTERVNSSRSFANRTMTASV